MIKRYLYLIRNAQYNPEGDNGGSLTDVGLKQATLTTQALRHVPVHAIYTAPYRQATETAKIIAILNRKIPIQEMDVLRQYKVIDMMQDTLTRKMLMENSGDEPKQQLEAAYAMFFRLPDMQSHSHELIICHANIIRDLICRAMNIKPESWAHMVIHNCGISVISIDEAGEIDLAAYNDVAHLPDRLQTET